MSAIYPSPVKWSIALESCGYRSASTLSRPRIVQNRQILRQILRLSALCRTNFVTLRLELADSVSSGILRPRTSACDPNPPFKFLQSRHSR